MITQARTMKRVIWFLALFLGFAGCQETRENNTLEKQKPKKVKVKITRKAACAGSWYPAEAEELKKALDERLEKAKIPPLKGKLLGVIAPHAGLVYSGAVAAYSFKALSKASFKRALGLGPSHRIPFSGIALPEADEFETPLGNLEVDKEAVERLSRSRVFIVYEKAHEPEHSLEMELIFLKRIAPDVKIVPCLVGDVSRKDIEEAAKAIRRELKKDDVIIVSSDFTHYGPRYQYLGSPPFPENVEENLRKLDQRAWNAVESLDPDIFLEFYRRTGDTICGRYPIAILLSVLPEGVKATRLKYDTSGRITGDYTNSVSYMAIAFFGKAWQKQKEENKVEYSSGPLNEEEKKLAREIAWKAVRSFVTERTRIDPYKVGLAPKGNLLKTLACFVTLKKNGRLRGCIGSIMARQPLWKDIVERAIDAAVNDPRFPPVTPDELDDLSLEISVLTPMKKVSGPKDIIIGKHGILLTKGYHRAVFLPQVAPEQGWDLETTLRHLCLKAGLPPDAWKEGCTFEVFEAQVF